MGGANAQTAISLAGAHLLSPVFDFSESVRANADDLINIHEPSSLVRFILFLLAEFVLLLLLSSYQYYCSFFMGGARGGY